MKDYHLATIDFLAPYVDRSKFTSNGSSEKKKPAASEIEDSNPRIFSGNTTGNEGGENIDPTTIGDQGQINQGGINVSGISTSEIASMCENARYVNGSPNTLYFLLPGNDLRIKAALLEKKVKTTKPGAYAFLECLDTFLVNN